MQSAGVTYSGNENLLVLYGEGTQAMTFINNATTILNQTHTCWNDKQEVSTEELRAYMVGGIK